MVAIKNAIDYLKEKNVDRRLLQTELNKTKEVLCRLTVFDVYTKCD